MVALPPALREPRLPVRAIATGWATAFFPSLLLAALAQWLLPSAAHPSFDVRDPTVVLLLVLFAPLVETLIMAAVLEVLLLLRVPAPAAVALSAVGWGVAHSIAAPAWGLVIWWPFLVFSTLYVVWRRRSVWAGVGVAASVHALQNLLPALLLLRTG